MTYEGELGDAMVHPEIKKFIEFGTSIFKRLKIVTNGGVRTPKFYKDLGADHFSIGTACFNPFKVWRTVNEINGDPSFGVHQT